MNKFILFLSLLFTTFQAIYFQSINIAPFPLLSLILLLGSVKFKPTIKETGFIVLFLLIILISILIGIINEDYLSGYSYYFPRTIGWVLFPFSVILFRNIFKKNDPTVLNEVVSLVLVFHLLLFFIQYFSFHFFHYKVDYLVNITGEEQRMGAAKLKEYGTNMIRTAGLFTEPGSYSVYIYILVSIKFILTKKVNLLIVISLISMLLSFSMTGILMVILFVLFQISFNKISFNKLFNAFFLIFGLGIVIYLKSDVFLGPIQERLYNLDEDGSADTRFGGGINFFISEGHLFSGIGIGALSDNIRATSVILGGLYDLGIIFLIVFLFLHLVYIYKWGEFKNIIFLFPVLLSNISFNQIIYTMFLGMLLLKFNKSKVYETISVVE